jgi:hypothetical protein
MPLPPRTKVHGAAHVDFAIRYAAYLVDARAGWDLSVAIPGRHPVGTRALSVPTLRLYRSGE